MRGSLLRHARRLFDRVRRHPANVRFDDFVRLVWAAGFQEVRVSGSHRVFRHVSRRELLLTLQDVRGQAKPYQVRQFVRLVEEYDLLEDR